MKPLQSRSLQGEMQVPWDELVKWTKDALLLGVLHNGVLKEGIAVPGYRIELVHNLGRAPRFIFPVMKSAEGDVWSPPHPTPHTHCYLESIFTVTVNVLIA